MRKFGSALLLVLLFAAWGWIELSKAPPETIRAADGAAVHIIDGDSLRIGETEIRIAGIDAPEYRQSCQDGAGQAWPCGKAAREALVKLAGAGELACEAHGKDRYGRTLADCRTGAGGANGEDLGSAMARAGLALDARDPRFAQHGDEIAAAQKARRGVWQGAHQHPAEWRKAHLPAEFGE